ncbi:MAG: hypothetical protein K2L57_07390, partial [Muribaculaceae bacterium]|nr:hypothetical protein [Muribaculaceae bacterium]
GGVTLNGFQDRRNRPLCHLSLVVCVAKLSIFFEVSKFFADCILWVLHRIRLRSPKIVNAGAAYFRGNFAS